MEREYVEWIQLAQNGEANGLFWTV